jgi:hypothetical protein
LGGINKGETAYNYFKLFLESVSGFPSIEMCLTTYYSAYPAIANQSLATFFPHLENMKDYLLKSVGPGQPFFRLHAAQAAKATSWQQVKGHQVDAPGNPTLPGQPTHSSLEPTWYILGKKATGKSSFKF